MTSQLPMELVKDIVSMSQEPKLNVAIYIGGELHFHAYRINKMIEVKKGDSNPFPIKNSKMMKIMLCGMANLDMCSFCEGEIEICYYVGNTIPPTIAFERTDNVTRQSKLLKNSRFDYVFEFDEMEEEDQIKLLTTLSNDIYDFLN